MCTSDPWPITRVVRAEQINEAMSEKLLIRDIDQLSKIMYVSAKLQIEFQKSNRHRPTPTNFLRQARQLFMPMPSPKPPLAAAWTEQTL